MSREDFIAGKPFTALNTEGEFVYGPAMNPTASRIGLIKDANQKTPGDCFCTVWAISGRFIHCHRYMLGTTVVFQVPLDKFTLVKAKKVKEVASE